MNKTFMIKNYSNQRAFSLVELLVVIAIIGLLSSLIISVSKSLLQKRQIDSIASGLAGWIEEVRNKSAKQVSSSDAVGGCQINFESALVGATNGAKLASLSSDSPSNCATEKTYTVDSSFAKASYNIQVIGSNQLAFTPRGSTITNLSSGASGQISVNIFMVGTSFLRCLRISPGLGSVDLGKNNSASTVSSSCTSFTRI